MPMYALATTPLIDHLKISCPDALQVWYADDASAGGSLLAIKKWWDDLCKCGPAFGYHVSAPKTWVLTKPQFLTEPESCLVTPVCKSSLRGDLFLVLL